MNFISETDVLTLDQVRVAAPSGFADRPWESVSHRYSFMATSSVVESLLAEGWKVTAARQQRVLLQDRKEFTRHVLRFRRNDSLALHVGDVFREVVLVNSHDRGSAYQMHAGLYRLVCSNGLVVDDGTFTRLSMRHAGNVLDDVRRGADNIIKEVPRILGDIRGIQGIMLTQEERTTFARAAMSLRFDASVPVEPYQVHAPKRRGDDEPNLWTTFNVVQENLSKGGLRYVVPAHRTEEGMYVPSRRARTREVKSIREDTKLNKA
jgi:hypothetical protein